MARLRQERVADENALLQRQISMRYLGQWRSLSVGIGSGPDALAEAVETFHEQHEREFAFSQKDQPVEIYQLHLTAIGKTPKPSFKPAVELNADPGSPRETRPVYFTELGWVDTPVFERDDMPAGAMFSGPAVIDQFDSTTVIPPNTTAVIDEWMNILIHLKEI